MASSGKITVDGSFWDSCGEAVYDREFGCLRSDVDGDQKNNLRGSTRENYSIDFEGFLNCRTTK